MMLWNFNVVGLARLLEFVCFLVPALAPKKNILFEKKNLKIDCNFDAATGPNLRAGDISRTLLNKARSVGVLENCNQRPQKN